MVDMTMMDIHVVDEEASCSFVRSGVLHIFIWHYQRQQRRVDRPFVSAKSMPLIA